jgi:phosphopantothenoylcysteine decarboxylase/phosphopantothenate--cysteine ligase
LHAAGADVVIMTAAVADFRPATSAKRKIKKREGVPTLELQPNPDILADLADVAPAALRVGFAAETEDLEREGRRKLEAKKAHFIVVNDVSRSDIGFGAEDNEVMVYGLEMEPLALPRQSKARLAHNLLNLFVEALRRRETDPVAL